MKDNYELLLQYLGLMIRLLKLRIKEHFSSKKRVDKCHHPVKHLFSN